MYLLVWKRLGFIWMFFFFSSRRRHTRYWRDWSSDVCSSDLERVGGEVELADVLEVGDVAHHLAVLAGGVLGDQEVQPQQQDVIVAQPARQLVDVEREREGAGALLVVEVVPPRGRVEHGAPAVLDAELGAHAGADRIALGRAEHVVARVARLEDLALEAAEGAVHDP